MEYADASAGELSSLFEEQLRSEHCDLNRLSLQGTKGDPAALNYFPGPGGWTRFAKEMQEASTCKARP